MRSLLRTTAFSAALLLACSEDPPKDEACSDDDCEMSGEKDKNQEDDDDDAPRDSGTKELDARMNPPSPPPDAKAPDANGAGDAAPAPDATVASDSSVPTPGQGSGGCGKTNVMPAGDGTIDISGTERDYIVALPENYDPNKKYKLIYAWHGLGGTAAQIARSWYGLQRMSAGSAIFVAGQGLEAGGGAGWPNTDGRDVAFVKALHARLLENFCIDTDRVFSVGMSYGGIMSNTLGCQMGDVFRAIAPMSGSGPRTRGTACTGQVAAWLAHGNQDTLVQFSQGEGSRDHWVEANHCDEATEDTDPSPCVAYQGCDDGHPVHWCEFDGGHTVPQFAAGAIWEFFDQF